jgi:hypothetical protein
MKLAKYAWLLATALAPVWGGNVQAQGAKKALHFNGNGVQLGTVDAVNLSTALGDSLAYSNFTIEMWVKVGSPNTGNPPLLANKNYTSGANNGICFTYTSSVIWGDAPAHSFRLNFKPNNGTRRDYDMTPANEYTWNHYAFTVDRKGFIKGYINGVYKPSTYTTGAGSIAADSAKSLAGVLPMFLATDGTGNYRVPFNGDIDEVRIWRTVRTESELRNSMCQRLQGNENSLLAYYRMDDTAAASLTNYAAAFTGQFTGTMVNAPVKVASGAPVGDTAVNLYTNSWTGQSLQLSPAAKGNFIVDSFATAGSYLHLYQVNGVPDSTAGLTAYNNNNVYFGTFAADTFGYYPKYAYSNYPTAVTYAGNISFFARKTNTDPVWAIRPSVVNNTIAKVLRLDSVMGSRQFFLANFINSCTPPTALSAQNVLSASASLSWTSGGSALWNIEYGPAGFTPGTGTRVNGVTTIPYAINGLQPLTNYQFYVKDTCVGAGSSIWAGPYSFTTLRDYSNIGGGYALHFNGTGVQNSTVTAVNLGKAIGDSLATTNFTLEMWVKVGATNTGNPPLIANKDYVSGANSGICWTYTASVLWGDAPKRVFRFNFKPTGGVRHDYDMTAANEYTWNHVAITVDRKGFIKGYINGVYKPSAYSTGATSIAVDSGKSLAGLLPMFLGTDGTGNYRVPFNADMDEVRIWTKVRTEAEIRESMCHKLQGNEQDLLAYYRMNEQAGTAVVNNAAATAGNYNGTLVNAPVRMLSAAPIGDSSAYIYPASGWNGISLSMPATNKGTITVDSVNASTVPGVHIYKVNSTPNFQKGISDMGTTDKYFGVFTADEPVAAYRLRYNYNNYPQAVAANANLHVYNRADNAHQTWAQLPAQHDMTGRTLEANQLLGTREYLLADFVAPSCAAPKLVKVDSVALTTAYANWQSTAAYHNRKLLQAGQDWTLATAGTVNANHEQLTGLVPNRAYEYFIQDSCGAGNTSAWVGPYYFKTLFPCPMPVQVYADSITTQSMVIKWTDQGTVTKGFDISWGISGTFTDPTIGIVQTRTIPRFAITGLQRNTEYDFYINTRCNAVNDSVSGWTGPFTFKTDSVQQNTGLEEATMANAVQLYPNPAQTYVQVQAAAGVAMHSYIIYSSVGAEMQRGDLLQGTNNRIHIGALPAGMYFFECHTDKGKVQKPLLIQH